MLRFTEHYYEDALSFAHYIQGIRGGEIEIVRESSEYFPILSKKIEMSEMIDCVKVGGIEIAYLTTDKAPDEEAKHRNKNLNRFIFGLQLQEYRMSHNISLEDIAAKTEYKIGTLRAIECGRFSLNVDILSKVLEAMDAHIEIVPNK